MAQTHQRVWSWLRMRSWLFYRNQSHKQNHNFGRRQGNNRGCGQKRNNYQYSQRKNVRTQDKAMHDFGTSQKSDDVVTQAIGQGPVTHLHIFVNFSKSPLKKKENNKTSLRMLNAVH
uniref:Uncharacterized protein n=1 Tax=Lactuca sativa TaxID=4236 RepID=A0A9R1XAV8_LACSA|nr:hypothetical protein LSAT_V11C500242600 [Lactuca sativa]